MMTLAPMRPTGSDYIILKATGHCKQATSNQTKKRHASDSGNEHESGVIADLTSKLYIYNRKRRSCSLPVKFCFGSECCRLNANIVYIAVMSGDHLTYVLMTYMVCAVLSWIMWIVLTKLFCVSGCQATSGFTKVSKALRGCSSWKAPNRPAGVGCAEICIKINIGKRNQRCSVFEDLACTCMGEKYVNIPSEKYIYVHIYVCICVYTYLCKMDERRSYASLS